MIYPKSYLFYIWIYFITFDEKKNPTTSFHKSFIFSQSASYEVWDDWAVLHF